MTADAPTMDQLVLQLLDDCGAMRPDDDPVRSALRFAGAAYEWPVRHADLMAGIAVACGGVMSAHLRRGLPRERARALADAWGKRVTKAMHDQDRAYIAKLLGGVQ
jgi:hypothetical protein